LEYERDGLVLYGICALMALCIVLFGGITVAIVVELVGQLL